MTEAAHMNTQSHRVWTFVIRLVEYTLVLDGNQNPVLKSVDKTYYKSSFLEIFFEC